MPDLRRQVLESGKTMSRKAASKEGSRRTSRASSAQNSHHSSRNASRQASDDEDAGNLSDDTAVSLGSFDDFENVDVEKDNSNWAQELLEVVDDILDRKRSSVLSREENYAAYCRLSKFHYVEESIRRRVPDLLAAFARSIKSETSVRETTLAMRALELLAITATDNTIFEHAEPLLTRTIRDSTSDAIKVAAIHCLGTCTMFGGGGDEAIEDQMTFFLDIVASDGQSIDAQDGAAACVTAALQEWGFMATEIDDLESESEEYIQIFMDQLSSGDPSVQIAAGENIALLYERSYTPQEHWTDEGEEDSNGENSLDSESEEQVYHTGPKRVKRYSPYHDTPELERQLQSLATVHSKRINKRDKRDLHKNFASIRATVADPRCGPMHSDHGSKLTVKIGRQGIMHIDRWWKWIRLNSLRRVLQGGFAVHYFEGNRAVLDNLPVMMVRRQTGDRRTSPTGRKEDKIRQNQRRAKLEFADDDYY
ncbi:IFRD domain-containing protein [Aspergillus foveolatus]|uniref:IFRD domain-containing protein n=1 Tax=Aspergillus foveolatus TaxID=210207 RepID=UPI003CCDF1A4